MSRIKEITRDLSVVSFTNDWLENEITMVIDAIQGLVSRPLYINREGWPKAGVS